MQAQIVAQPGECKVGFLTRRAVKRTATANYTVPIMGTMSMYLQVSSNTVEAAGTDIEDMWYHAPALHFFQMARVKPPAPLLLNQIERQLALCPCSKLEAAKFGQNTLHVVIFT